MTPEPDKSKLIIKKVGPFVIEATSDILQSDLPITENPDGTLTTGISPGVSEALRTGKAVNVNRSDPSKP